MAHLCMELGKTCRRACVAPIGVACKHVKDNKGRFGGYCNRTACLAHNPRWLNRNNFNTYYCEACAILLNRENAHHEFWKPLTESGPLITEGSHVAKDGKPYTITYDKES